MGWGSLPVFVGRASVEDRASSPTYLPIVGLLGFRIFERWDARRVEFRTISVHGLGLLKCSRRFGNTEAILPSFLSG